MIKLCHHCEQVELNPSGDPLRGCVECLLELSSLETNICLLTAIPKWSRILPLGLTPFRSAHTPPEHRSFRGALGQLISVIKVRCC